MKLADLGHVNWLLFDAKVDRSGDCHLWMACTSPAGYGRFGIGSRADGSRRSEYAHRLVVLRAGRQIPDGLGLAMRITQRENVRRAFADKTTMLYGDYLQVAGAR